MLVLLISLFSFKMYANRGYINQHDRIIVTKCYDNGHLKENSKIQMIKPAKGMKIFNTYLKSINNVFINDRGTYMEGSKTIIVISGTKMLYTVKEDLHFPKFINVQESKLEIAKCRFISNVENNNEIKIRSIDPVGPINIMSTAFNDLTYKNDSSSGIVFNNIRKANQFSVNFSDCIINVNNNTNFTKGDRGGFLLSKWL